MREIDPAREIIDLEPVGTPPSMPLWRRWVCAAVGVPLGLAGLYCVTSPGLSGLALVMGSTLLFGAAILVGSALFPSLTFQKINRNRWR